MGLRINAISSGAVANSNFSIKNPIIPNTTMIPTSNNECWMAYEPTTQKINTMGNRMFRGTLLKYAAYFMAIVPIM